MNTPIFDFVQNYSASNIIRLHMPGHKGKPVIGTEPFDVTEIKGADSLYEASGIIAESEANASHLFGSGKTVYSTEGSSQCIKAMLFLAMQAGGSKTVVAGRNVHKSFVHAAALLDLDIVWIWPDEGTDSICSCIVSDEKLDNVLSGLSEPPAAVYITSPDYLGGGSNISGLASVCHRHGTILAVDNAHGAYLHFLPKPEHPMDLGADICCDSAHKTLPVLTGGAYLHISKYCHKLLSLDVKAAMGMFGSTSPSYLILSSLDAANDYMSKSFSVQLAQTVETLSSVKAVLSAHGWEVVNSDPLKLTVRADNCVELAERLRAFGVECEYADPDYLVLMATPQNSDEEFEILAAAMCNLEAKKPVARVLPVIKTERVMSIREAVFANQETVSVDEADGRVCASPVVSCPPAIPVVVSGELITREAISVFKYYGIETIMVIKKERQ